MQNAPEEHERWMREALRAAQEAQTRAEVPIGSCVVADGQLVAIAGNRTRTDCDPTAHAEIVALREAAAKSEITVWLARLFIQPLNPVRCVPAL